MLPAIVECSETLNSLENCVQKWPNDDRNEKAAMTVMKKSQNFHYGHQIERFF